MSYRSGPCTARYSPASAVGGSGTAALGTAAPTYVSIGATETGFTKRRELHHQPVHNDEYGEAPVDGIDMGSTHTVHLTFIEYDLIKAVIAARGNLLNANAKVGIPLSYLGGPLVITPVAGTPLATEIGTGKSRIFYKAIAVTDFEYLMGAGLMKGPCTFLCLPDPNNTNKVYDDVTTPP